MSQVLVIDFGAQYAQLIARRVRTLNFGSLEPVPDEPVQKAGEIGGGLSLPIKNHIGFDIENLQAAHRDRK